MAPSPVVSAVVRCACAGSLLLASLPITTAAEFAPMPSMTSATRSLRGAAAGEEYLCCHGSLESCRAPGDSCAESKETCEGRCEGQWSEVEYKCCYSDGNCKEEGNWCNAEESRCTGPCSGQWTRSLAPTTTTTTTTTTATTTPEPEPSKFLCCYGSIESCKAPADWCAQSSERCEGSCSGRWSEIEYRCCYSSGFCQEEGNWCNGAESRCTGSCSGQWTQSFAPTTTTTTTTTTPAPFLCCYGGIETCKEPGDWCAESQENCEGPCSGRWSQSAYKCCYADGHCQEEGNWCNVEESRCTDQCSGQWTRVLG